MAPNTVFNSDAQVGFEAGKEVGEGSFRKGEIEGVPFTLVGTGYHLTLRPELLERPKRSTGTIAVADIDGGGGTVCGAFLMTAPIAPMARKPISNLRMSVPHKSRRTRRTRPTTFIPSTGKIVTWSGSVEYGCSKPCLTPDRRHRLNVLSPLGSATT